MRLLEYFIMTKDGKFYMKWSGKDKERIKPSEFIFLVRKHDMAPVYLELD